MKNGIELIKEERIRQVNVEGWSIEQDNQHNNSELAKLAACYALPEETRELHPCPWRSVVPIFYPRWGTEWWKPTPEDRLRELAKAGALIAA